MYSPKQLAENKMQRSQNEKHFQHSRVASVADGIKLEKEKKLYDLLHKHSVSKQIQSSREHYSPIHRYRQYFQYYLANQEWQVIIKTQLFQGQRGSNRSERSMRGSATLTPHYFRISLLRTRKKQDFRVLVAEMMSQSI